jgi:hypothetical protein
MTECNQLASYIVRRHAGFDANQARRHIRKPRRNPAASIVIAYRRDRQLVLVLPKQFVAKRDEFVIGQLAPEDLAFVARGCCRPLSARRDGRDLSYPFDHSNLLRMEARSTKSFSAMMCACSDSNGSLSAPRMALAKRSISLEGVG